jgi:hypothetical protein
MLLNTFSRTSSGKSQRDKWTNPSPRLVTRLLFLIGKTDPSALDGEVLLAVLIALAQDGFHLCTGPFYFL